jgi:hypothetical protein
MEINGKTVIPYVSYHTGKGKVGVSPSAKSYLGIKEGEFLLFADEATQLKSFEVDLAWLADLLEVRKEGQNHKEVVFISKEDYAYFSDAVQTKEILDKTPRPNRKSPDEHVKLVIDKVLGNELAKDISFHKADLLKVTLVRLDYNVWASGLVKNNTNTEDATLEALKVLRTDLVKVRNRMNETIDRIHTD